MKTNFTLLLLLLLGSHLKSIAQCPNNTTLAAGSLTPPGVSQSIIKEYRSGQYMLAYCQAGASYTVSTCRTITGYTPGDGWDGPEPIYEPGTGTSYDSQLTIYGEDGTYLGYNDDACGLQATITFTSSKCQFIRVLLHQYSCNSSGLLGKVKMTQNTAGSALAALPTGTANATICNNTSTSLTATCTGTDTVKWYDVTGTSLQFTGSPFVTPNLTANTTYKVRCEAALACNSDFVDVVVSVVSGVAPVITAPTQKVVCSPSTLTLTASACPGTVNWSNGSSGTSITFSAVGTYSITATCTRNGCISQASTPVGLEIKAKPTTPVVSPPANLVVCAPNTLMLTASCATGAVLWSTGATGTSLNLSIVGTYAITATCTLNGCSSDASSAVTGLEIKAKPAAPTVTPPANLVVCAPNTLTLTATCTTGTVLWSTGATGTTTTISSVGTYAITATCQLNGCSSDPSATVTGLEIKPKPAIPTGTANATICNNTNTSLTATCTGTDSVNWYDATGTSLQFTGSPFVTPNLTANTTYKVRCETPFGCNSNFVDVTVSLYIDKKVFAIQDFEVTPQTPTLSFTGPVVYNSGTSLASAEPPSSPLGIGGSRAWETTSNSGGLALDFGNISIPSGYDSIRVNFKLAAMNLLSPGGGPDNLDFVLVEYSTNGGTNYVSRLRIKGAVNDNSTWPYSATGSAKVYYQPATEAVFQPITSGLQDALGYSNCEIVFPGNISQLKLRITGRSSSSTDTWLIDNVSITGEKVSNAVPVIDAITETVCNNTSTSLTATCTGTDTVNWYDATGTSLQFTGSPFVTPNLTANTTYKVRCETPFGCNSNFVDITVYIYTGKKILAIQDFEVTPQTPTWSFTGPVVYNSGTSLASAEPPSSPLGIGGSRAWETTSNSGGLALDFGNISIPSGYDSIRVNFKLAAMNLLSPGGGPDDLDYVLVQYSTDGGTNYVSRLRIKGAVNDNSTWPYSATGSAKVYYQPATEAVFQPITSGLQDALGYSNCEIVFPGNISQLKLRITGRSSSSTDTWLIDNVSITGERVSDIAPVINAPTEKVVCSPSTLTLTASACSGTVNWSDGSSGTSITLSAVGTYAISATCTVNGCISEASTPVNLEIKAKPTSPTVTPPANLVVCAPNTLTLTASCATGTVLWSTGATGTSLNLANVGTYAITVTCTLNGCSSDASSAVTGLEIKAKPTVPVVTPPANLVVCAPNTLTLTATCTTGTVLWSTGATSSSLNLASVGTYAITATCTLNGCSSDASAVVNLEIKAKPTVPTVTPPANLVVCAPNTLTLTATCTTGTVLWSTGATGTSLNLSSVGTYAITATCTLNGCSSDASAVVNLEIKAKPTVPTVTPPANLIVCAPNTLTLTASCATGTVLWSTGATGTSLNLANVGTYAITVTCTLNGCSSNASSIVNLEIKAKPTTPVVTPPANLVVCAPNTLTLTASCATGTVLWSTGATGTSLTLSSVGNYAITATCELNGCSSNASSVVNLEIKAKPTTPVVTPPANLVVCAPNTLTLTASCATGTVLWSNGASGTSLNLSSVGTYAITATCELNSCSSDASSVVNLEIKAKPTVPVVTPPANLVVCAPNTLTLTASCATGTVLWSTGATGTSLNLSSVGTYAITATCTLNGCSSDASSIVNLEIKAKPTSPVVTPLENLVVCAPNTLTLTASCATGTVLWSTGATSTSIMLSNVGTYAITATCTLNGCSSDASSIVNLEIKAKPTTPVVTPPANLVVCAPNTLTLTASCATGTVLWSNGATGTSLNISSVGTYAITATCTLNGCSSDASSVVNMEIKAKPATPVVTPPANLVVCAPNTLTLTASCATGTVLWSNGATGTSLSLSSVGTYAITATCTLNGCSSDASSVVNLEIKAKPATPVVTPPANLVVCAPNTLTLTASCATGTVLWSNGATGTSLSLSSVGTYAITATCTLNGCSSDASSVVNLEIKAKPTTPVVSPPANLVVCSPNTLMLTASCATGTVLWSNGATGTSLSLSSVGTYAVTATCTLNGCNSDPSSIVNLEIKAKPATPVVTPPANLVVCAPNTLTLTASCATGTVLWSTGATGTSLNLTSVGSYAITATCELNGCSSDASSVVNLEIKAKPTTPVVSPPANLVVCAPNTLTLTASCATGTVLWSTGASGTSLTLSSVGTYGINATCTLNGCSSDASSIINLEIKALPVVTASNTGPYTVGQTINLTGSGGGTYSWSGPNNFTSSTSSPSIPNALLANGGIYTLTVVGVNGCSAIATTNVIINGTDPCDPNRIVDYTYVKAANPYQPLFPLTNGMSINQISDQVTILVSPSLCPSVTIESLEMNIQGPELNWNIVQNVAPNALFDNYGDNFNGRNFIPGNYTLTVTGYAQDNKGGGITYGPVITTFTVIGNNLATISMPTMTGTAFCAGSTFDVSFSTTGTFDGGNQFQVQLSDASGSFANPVIIGTTNVAGSVNVMIPLNTPAGSNYLIRVSSTNQVVAGNPTMNKLTIHPYSLNLVSPTDDLTGTNTRKAVSMISASNKVSSPANVQYTAGNAIILTPGFETGAVFRAEIQGCSN